QIPITRPSHQPQTDHPTNPPVWDWEGSLEQSIPGVGIGDMSGTGKVPAIVPLTAGESGWSKGVRAPRANAAGAAAIPAGGALAEFEADQQPSVQMRALRAGNLARATAIVTAAMLLSKIFGLGRTSFFAYVFGATPQADAYVNAFALPDTIFTIVAGGALASAFIPVFADYMIEKHDRETAWHIASSALNISMLVLTILSVLGIIFAPQFLDITLHPYFVCSPGKVCEGPLIVSLTRIMLLQPIFLGGATIAVSILQARQSFLLPALAQVIYTVSLIGGIAATLVDRNTHIFGGHLGINGPAYGVVAGAILQFIIPIPGLFRAKMHYRLSFDFLHPGVRDIFRLMAPRVFNAGILFVSLYINRDLLGILNQKGVVYGYVTAFTLVTVPNSIFGMATAQAAFPTLAALVSAGEWQRLRTTILRSVRGVMFLAVPSGFGLIVLSDPISKLILAHGQFDPRTVPLVAQPLIFFSIGLVGLSLVEILVRCFYALHDSRTPVEVSVLQFMFVIGLSIVLLSPMGANGLALATSLGSLGEAVVLLLLLRPRLGGLDLKELGMYTLNVVAASVVMALTALFVYTLALVVLPLHATSVIETVDNAIRVLAAMLAAGAVYFAFSHYLGTDDVLSFERILRRFRRR
ncbi:MAG: murein biosynthesis integral membrane protein MurJ, partial [Ktedonobacterales bacterium]